MSGMVKTKMSYIHTPNVST
ncbi:hypothetical protein F383_17867 [Gossypium arboreum]|uniref:Uncharacterized protein n=1 Tax=Gossypium arboreum TaxID=29729 RepID=A0A0B0NMZ0_GOSAR|nr:hypothetical protein F383_17867 [Gossypium arboreum]